MHFGFALDSSDIDLWNIDLLDAHLDLLYTDIPSKHFVCLEDILKKSSRQDFIITIFRLPRRLQAVFKTSWKRPLNFLEDGKLLRWGNVEDIFKTCLEDVLKTNKCLVGYSFRFTINELWNRFPLNMKK